MTYLDLSSLTWTCMVCGDERPDAAISVAYHPIEHRGIIMRTARYQQRYCNDRPGCIAEATRPGPYVIPSDVGPDK